MDAPLALDARGRRPPSARHSLKRMLL